YTGGDRGILKALDQKTGDERWRFDTIQSPDFWSNNSVNSGGGAWYPPSIDIDSGRVFWAVANPAPFPGTPQFPNGSSRPGDNLYTDSTLALDVRSGAYQWHHQTIQHDLFDRDLLHTMLTEVAGVPIVVSTGKEGRVWANRRDNGEVLWGPVEVGMHMNDHLTELTATTRVLPGSFGGVLTPPALAEGVVYVAMLNAPTTYSANQTAYFGSEVGTMNGDLVAIDVATGKILWNTTVEGDPTGGATVVNDLVITATFQGNVIAYQRETGKEVWRWKAPGGINSWMSVSGDTLVIPVGSASPAVVVALRLSGTNTMPGSAGAGGATAGSGAAGNSAPAGNPNSFSAIYTQIMAQKCAGSVCHSGTATGGSLSLQAGNASAVRSSLINRPASASECATSGLSLVVPGSPDMSLLYRKLTDMPPCGSRMPPTGALTAEEIGRVRTWIANGALDD
ncbi:MAG TPA: PQQ-binding-like beta-propeller repeat protein, partial [Polyangiales bacterium]|nr:PQQ-binding-like beta-propeller repeat protein [Polyangiales bacterium]